MIAESPRDSYRRRTAAMFSDWPDRLNDVSALRFAIRSSIPGASQLPQSLLRMTHIGQTNNLPMTRSPMLKNMSIRPASLAALDLNLLVVFDAVFVERHISRAARRLGKSQPAVSGALARLRSLFNEPLFVRDGAGVRPTRLARELATPIREALELLNESLRREREFAPAASDRTFQLNLNDYTQTILLPRLLAHLKEHAPNVHLATMSLPADEMESALKRGALDLALDSTSKNSSTTNSCAWCEKDILTCAAH